MRANSLPKIFYIILLIEIFERFAFYGLQSVAVIYFIKNLGFSEAESSNVFASFSALAYAMLVIGGIVGDRILGLQRTYLLGILSLLFGYLAIALATTMPVLYFGMSLVIVGNVLFKPNANNYVGRCFGSDNASIDAGFTYFYMIGNIGIFLGTVIVPTTAKLFGYTIALNLCFIAMCISLLIFFIFRRQFASVDNAVTTNKKSIYTLVITLAISSAILMSLLLDSIFASSIILYSVFLIVVIVYLYIASKLPALEAKGMYVTFVLWLFSIAFFTSYIQIATSLTLFALHNVDLNFFGYIVPAGVTQSLDPFFITLLSPFLSSLYIFLYKKNINYNIANKFATGILLVGLCFITLSIGGSFFTNANSQISVIWLILAYILYAAGELLVSALGASMIVQLLPARICGFGQGIWYLGAAVGMKIGGQIFALVESFTKSTNNTALLDSYISLFNLIGISTIVIAAILFISSVPLSKAVSSVILTKNPS